MQTLSNLIIKRFIVVFLAVLFFSNLIIFTFQLGIIKSTAAEDLVHTCETAKTYMEKNFEGKVNEQTENVTKMLSLAGWFLPEEDRKSVV